MDYSGILNNVAKHISLSKGEIEFFTSLLAARQVAKGELIVEEAQRCTYINYVNTGAFRAYAFDRHGSENTIMFAIEDWWITDIHGFVKGKPAMMNVEAIEESSIRQLHIDGLERLYDKVPKFERFFRILMQNSYIREQLRIKDNLTTQAEERYRLFINKYPQFINRVPLKQVASYLGVTPQFLSVIRNRLAKGS